MTATKKEKRGKIAANAGAHFSLFHRLAFIVLVIVIDAQRPGCEKRPTVAAASPSSADDKTGYSSLNTSLSKSSNQPPKIAMPPSPPRYGPCVYLVVGRAVEVRGNARQDIYTTCPPRKMGVTRGKNT